MTVTHTSFRARRRRLAVALTLGLLVAGSGTTALADETGVVALPREEQLARLLARDKTLCESDARARIAAQMPLREKCARADVVIDNSGTKEETQQRVKELWRERIIERA